MKTRLRNLGNILVEVYHILLRKTTIFSNPNMAFDQNYPAYLGYPWGYLWLMAGFHLLVRNFGLDCHGRMIGNGPI
jgi:hypothetical protein